MCSDNKNHTFKRAYWGTLLILAGTILLITNLGLLPFALPAYVFSWKMLLVLIGFSFLLMGRPGGLFPLLIGSYFILPEAFGIVTPGIKQLWPVFIILFGLLIIFKRKPHSGWRKKKEWKRRSPSIESIPEATSELKDGIMETTVIFGGQTKKVSAYDFKGGKCTAIFGGLEIDLTNCYLSSEKGTVEITAVFGGITLKVPKEWNIKSEIIPIMGGVEDAGYMNNHYIDPAAELVLKGSVIMGGVEIIRE